MLFFNWFSSSTASPWSPFAHIGRDADGQEIGRDVDEMELCSAAKLRRQALAQSLAIQREIDEKFEVSELLWDFAGKPIFKQLQGDQIPREPELGEIAFQIVDALNTTTDRGIHVGLNPM